MKHELTSKHQTRQMLGDLADSKRQESVRRSTIIHRETKLPLGHCSHSFSKAKSRTHCAKSYERIQPILAEDPLCAPHTSNNENNEDDS